MMNTDQKELFLLRKAYQETQSDILVASEKIQTILGFESEPRDALGQLIITPWHMPLPRELQRQIPKSGPEPRKPPVNGTVFSQHIRLSKRKTESPNLLERSLHNKHLAQNLASSGTTVSVPLRSRDINLPILAKSSNLGKATETANNILKRKLSKLKVPSDSKDESLTEFMPDLSTRPAYRQQFRIYMSICDNYQSERGQKKIDHLQPDDGDRSESPSPPHRRSMPPIAAVLAHGFRNISLGPPSEPITPRSHAFDPWTRFRLGRTALTPTPAFLLSLQAFKNDDSQNSIYWKPSLPVIISYHLANPATLVHETKIKDVVFYLPIPRPTIVIDTTTRRRAPVKARQPHYKAEGPETNTEIRLIRMILPPTIPNKFHEHKGQQVPFTDWLILCLSSPAPPPPPPPPRAPTHNHNTRSSTQTQPRPYLIIAIPTQSIRNTEFVARSPIVSPADQQQRMATTILINFGGRGKVPSMFGVNRDCAFVDRWVQGFAHGHTALEVTYLGGQPPCWL